MKSLSLVMVAAFAATGSTALAQGKAESKPMGKAEGKMAKAKPVTYQITFTAKWTAKNHPLEYPEAGVLTGPHFSGVIGCTHNGEYSLYKAGMMPTPGLERLSEEGKHSPLDAEIKAAIGAGKAGAMFATGPIKDIPKAPAVSAKFTIDEGHSMVSAVAMIAPSPDWFAGAADVNLFEGGKWVESKTVTAYAWDSGGDDGATYKASDADTNPKKQTKQADSAHFLVNGAAVPVAEVTFKKM